MMIRRTRKINLLKRLRGSKRHEYGMIGLWKEKKGHLEDKQFKKSALHRLLASAYLFLITECHLSIYSRRSGSICMKTNSNNWAKCYTSKAIALPVPFCRWQLEGHGWLPGESKCLPPSANTERSSGSIFSPSEFNIYPCRGWASFVLLISEAQNRSQQSLSTLGVVGFSQTEAGAIHVHTFAGCSLLRQLPGKLCGWGFGKVSVVFISQPPAFYRALSVLCFNWLLLNHAGWAFSPGADVSVCSR